MTVVKLLLDGTVALGYKGGIGGKSWVPVEEMVAAFYDIVVIVQNMKRAR